MGDTDNIDDIVLDDSWIKEIDEEESIYKKFYISQIGYYLIHLVKFL